MASDDQTAKRRRTLEVLASAAPPPPSGVSTPHPILLARIYHPHHCNRLRAALGAAGISSNVQTKGEELAVFFPPVHRDQAFEILAVHLKTHPNQRPKGIGRVYDAVFLLSLAGALIGLLFVLSGRGWVGVACFVTFVSVGFSASRLLRNLRWYGRWQFTLAEFIWLTVLFSGVLVLWRIALQS